MQCLVRIEKRSVGRQTRDRKPSVMTMTETQSARLRARDSSPRSPIPALEMTRGAVQTVSGSCVALQRGSPPQVFYPALTLVSVAFILKSCSLRYLRLPDVLPRAWGVAHSARSFPMFFEVKDLELHPIEFAEKFEPGSLDLGSDYRQIAPWIARPCRPRRGASRQAQGNPRYSDPGPVGDDAGIRVRALPGTANAGCEARF